MEEKIGILPWSDVPELIKIYENSDIHYYPIYAIIQNWHWWHTFPDSQAYFVCPNGKVDEHGTFAIVVPEFKFLIFESKNPDLHATELFLKHCLTLCLENNDFVVLGPTEQTFWPVVENAALELELNSERNNATCYFMEKEDVVRIPSNCPDEAVIAPVQEKHADEINAAWPHRSEGSEHFIRAIIHRNGGVGIFLKESNELIAYTLHCHYNGPGQLQTVEAHRRKGYGKLSLIEGAKYAAQKGLHTLAYVVDGNTPSHTLFGSLGFKPLRRSAWFLVTKKAEH